MENKIYRFKIQSKEFYDHIISDIKDYNTEVDFWLVASGIHGKIFCNAFIIINE